MGEARREDLKPLASGPLAPAAGPEPIGAWHLYSLKGARVLFRPTGWGTMSLAAFAGLFLSRMPLIPAVAAFGAGCGDLGMVAIVMFLLVRFLVRFVPPS